MTSKYWIKLYHEIIDDPKMGRLPDRLWRRSVEVFLLAGEYDRGGYLPSVNDIAWRLRGTEEEVEADLVELQKIGITTRSDDGWTITNWEARQSAMSSTERTRRRRQLQKRKGPRTWVAKRSAELPESGGVYEIYCTETGRRYIGASVAIRRRVTDHLALMQISPDHHPMGQDFIEHGKSSIEVKLLENVDDPERLVATEARWFRKYPLDELYNTSAPGTHRDWNDGGPNRPRDTDTDTDVDTESDTEQHHVVAALKKVGIDPEMISEIVDNFEPEAILERIRQYEYADRKGIAQTIGYLIDSITKNWKPPRGYKPDATSERERRKFLEGDL